MNRSESIDKLVEALAKAQSEFTPAKKDTVNPYYSSKYADLAEIMAATMPALSKNGLSVIQCPMVDYENKMAGVEAILAHSSGQHMATSLMLPAQMKGKDGNPRFDAQSIGAAITYARRYTYQPLVGIAAEVDDDANSISGAAGSKEEAQAVAKRKSEAAGETVPSLFYVWNDENQTAEITGSVALRDANAKLLRPLWSATAGCIVANAEQLEALKYEFEKSGTPFRPLKAKTNAKPATA